MATWYVDIVLDLNWFCERGGTVPQPAARSKIVDDRKHSVEFLIYGEGEAISHLRILIQASDYEEASTIVNSNIVYWRDAIAVTSIMTSSNFSSVAVLGANSSAHPVMMGEGDGETPLATFKLQWAKPIPADYKAAANAMAMWPLDFRFHLHFLAKFLDPNLPADIRWLQGYRFLEWHFERGSTNLGKNAKYKQFLAFNGTAWDQFMPAGRTRAGFIEEIRAVVAHALLADRPTAEARAQVQSAATNTLKALEHLIMTILNEFAPSGVEFRPKPSPEQNDAGSV